MISRGLLSLRVPSSPPPPPPIPFILFLFPHEREFAFPLIAVQSRDIDIIIARRIFAILAARSLFSFSFAEPIISQLKSPDLIESINDNYD